MPSDIRVKICGLTTQLSVNAAVSAGAAYVGFTFFPRSPRFVTLEDARALAIKVPEGIVKVALVVDPQDAFLDDLTAKVPIDMLQLHGKESPERVSEIKERYGLPVMKAVGLASESDLPQLEAYARVADQILADTKPPEGADRPGGNAVAFDWGLIAGHRWNVPWMLAGGLTSGNVAQAIASTGARQVDVSSGVESARGVKDPELIREFIAAAQAM